MSETLVDTDAETTRVHLELVRAASSGRRLGLARSLSATVIGLARADVSARLPDATPNELAVAFVKRLYGAELADGLRVDLATRRP